MAKQSIVLKIAGRSYSFAIDKEKEEVYRLAEREVNSGIASYERQKYQNFSLVDHVALTALRFAISNIDTRREGALLSDDMKDLEQIDEQIDQYLNTLDSEVDK